jgi:hypothetical protein
MRVRINPVAAWIFAWGRKQKTRRNAAGKINSQEE